MKKMSKIIKRTLCFVIAGVMAMTAMTASMAAAETKWQAIEGGAQNGKGLFGTTGFNWTVPSSGSASIGAAGTADAVKRELAIFAYRFDGVRAPAVTEEEGPAWLFGLDQMNTNMTGSMEAVDYFATKFGANGYIIPNIISSKAASRWSWAPTDLKELNDAAADLVFGANFMPASAVEADKLTVVDPLVSESAAPVDGDDTKAFRANESRVNIFGQPGANVDEKVAAYAASTGANYGESTFMRTTARGQITYGGTSYYAAKVGGVWDVLLSEGRRFWFFGEEGGNVKNHLTGNTLTAMRSGNSFTAQGDVITALEYRINNNGNFATMGQSITPIKGKATEVTIRFQSAGGIDHIDLIGGEVGEVPVKADNRAGTIYNPINRMTEKYKADTVDTTTLVKRFEKSELKLENGWYSVSFTLPASDKEMYYRLRGTNNTVAGAGYDAAHTPKAGNSAADNLWFYSNPIYVNPEIEDGVTVMGTLKDKDGKAIAGKIITMQGSDVSAVTDENGKFTLPNLRLDKTPGVVHTLQVRAADGTLESALAFNLERDPTDVTEFNLSKVYVTNDVYAIEVEFKLEGATLSITSVKDHVPATSATVTQPPATTAGSNDKNPPTGVDTRVFIAMFFGMLIAGCAIIVSRPKFNKEKK